MRKYRRGISGPRPKPMILLHSARLRVNRSENLNDSEFSSEMAIGASCVGVHKPTKMRNCMLTTEYLWRRAGRTKRITFGRCATPAIWASLTKTFDDTTRTSPIIVLSLVSRGTENEFEAGGTDSLAIGVPEAQEASANGCALLPLRGPDRQAIRATRYRVPYRAHDRSGGIERHYWLPSFYLISA